jgi:hypothetical protein
MNQDWSIQTRGEACSATGAAFAAGEIFHTLLFYDKEGLRREDLCQKALAERPEDAPKPFSQWRSKFEPPPAKPPEALGKQSAEQLLRTYMEDPDPKLCNVRYILAVMLERKRTIKEVETRRSEDGALLRIYQFPKTGEVLVIPDPQLRLSQMAEIQLEVASLLGAPAAPAPEAAAEPAPEAAAEPAPEAAAEPAPEAAAEPAPDTAPAEASAPAAEPDSRAEPQPGEPQPQPEQNPAHAPEDPQETQPPQQAAEPAGTDAPEAPHASAAPPDPV